MCFASIAAKFWGGKVGEPTAWQISEREAWIENKSKVQNFQLCIWRGPNFSGALMKANNCVRVAMLYIAGNAVTVTPLLPASPLVSTQSSANLRVNNLWAQVIHFCCQTTPVSDLCCGSQGSQHWWAFSGWLLVSMVLPGRFPWAWWVWLKGQSQAGSLSTLCLLQWILSEVFSSIPFYVAQKRGFPGLKQVNKFTVKQDLSDSFWL